MMVRIFFIAGFCLVSTSALADALDGDWCNPNDGKLTVDGSKIITSGGVEVIGNYTRHRFEYTAPAGDWQAGKSIILRQFSDELMELSIGGGKGVPWRPCQVVS